MATETLERPRVGGPDSGVGGNWLVIVLNDDHNTFDHVANTLARAIPGVSVDDGYRLADRIHGSGQAIGVEGAEGDGQVLPGAAQRCGADLGPPGAALSAPSPHRSSRRGAAPA